MSLISALPSVNQPNYGRDDYRQHACLLKMKKPRNHSQAMIPSSDSGIVLIALSAEQIWILPLYKSSSCQSSGRYRVSPAGLVLMALPGTQFISLGIFISL